MWRKGVSRFVKLIVCEVIFDENHRVTFLPFSFPGTSVLFLYRNVKETVVSFQRVMAAFTTLARFFTNDQVLHHSLTSLKDRR